MKESNKEFTKERSYNQFCGLAYALDIVGERWTLLIVRELMPGPRRFKDLVDGLPGISTNLLTERLKNLEQHGLVNRRTLPPPAGSTVYELTALGQTLERTLLELGKWGSQFAPPTPEGVALLRLGSYALTPQVFFRRKRARGVRETYAIHANQEVLQIRIADGEIHVQQGESWRADAVFHTDVLTYLGLLRRQIEPAEAIATGLVQVEGDPAALQRFVKLCGLPAALEPESVV
jgi:DNA-binding HxlR family transcriptional regulator